MLGAILGAGASLLGGLFGRSSKKKAAKKQEAMFNEAKAVADYASIVPHTVKQEMSIDIAQMRKDAEAAGFNPVAVMRAGGLSGYIRQRTDETGHNAALPANIRAQLAGIPPVEVPSMGEVFSGALATGVSLFNDERAALANANLQRELQSSYIKGAGAANLRGSNARLFGIPTVTSRGVEIKNQSRPSLGSSTTPKASGFLPEFMTVPATSGGGWFPVPLNSHDQSKIVVTDDEFINPLPKGWVPSWMPSAQAWQSILGEGEIAETVVAAGNTAVIGGWNLYRAARGAINQSGAYLSQLGTVPKGSASESAAQRISRSMGGWPAARLAGGR